MQRTTRDLSKANTTVMINPFDEFELEEIAARRLYINDVIDESIIETIVYHILRFNREDKGKAKEERQPILLYINTPGGSVVDGFGLIDAIICSKTPIYTINQAMCASMGFLIFLAGEKRFTMPHCTFLMHDGSGFACDSMAKMKDRMEFEAQQVEVMVKKYIMDHTSIDEDLYNEKYRIEWYMLPQEAKRYNIADYIVGEDCDIDDMI